MSVGVNNCLLCVYIEAQLKLIGHRNHNTCACMSLSKLFYCAISNLLQIFDIMQVKANRCMHAYNY